MVAKSSCARCEGRPSLGCCLRWSVQTRLTTLIHRSQIGNPTYLSTHALGLISPADGQSLQASIQFPAFASVQSALAPFYNSMVS